jgi:hypothetical protein
VRHFQYYGVRHGLPTWSWFLLLWRKFQCRRGCHLLDEIRDMRAWFMVCDACGLEVHIMTVDDRYVKEEM